MTQVQHQLDSPTYVISDDKEIREGQEAWSRLKKHMSWSDWTSVGRAHLKGRQAAMREACTNEPTGGAITKYLIPSRIGAPPVASWLAPNGDDLPPSLHEHYTRFIATKKQPP